MNNLSIRRLVYSLKRQWGIELTYVQIVSSTLDERTGKRNIVRNVFTFKGVVLPQHLARKFIQDIGYLAANKNFTYGALNDFNKVSVLFDRQDLPLDFKPELNGYINYTGKRYERVSFDNFLDEAFLLIAQGVEGANPYAVLDVCAESRLQIQGRATVELN